jgi:hypothetical protein
MIAKFHVMINMQRDGTSRVDISENKWTLNKENLGKIHNTDDCLLVCLMGGVLGSYRCQPGG